MFPGTTPINETFRNADVSKGVFPPKLVLVATPVPVMFLVSSLLLFLVFSLSFLCWCRCMDKKCNKLLRWNHTAQHPKVSILTLASGPSIFFRFCCVRYKKPITQKVRIQQHHKLFTILIFIHCDLRREDCLFFYSKLHNFFTLAGKYYKDASYLADLLICYYYFLPTDIR